MKFNEAMAHREEMDLLALDNSADAKVKLALAAFYFAVAASGSMVDSVSKLMDKQVSIAEFMSEVIGELDMDEFIAKINEGIKFVQERENTVNE